MEDTQLVYSLGLMMQTGSARAVGRLLHYIIQKTVIYEVKGTSRPPANYMSCVSTQRARHRATISSRISSS
jgi:hypothetical protein